MPPTPFLKCPAVNPQSLEILSRPFDPGGVGELNIKLQNNFPVTPHANDPLFEVPRSQPIESRVLSQPVETGGVEEFLFMFIVVFWKPNCFINCIMM